MSGTSKRPNPKQLAGRQGGTATLANHGVDHFRAIGALGGQTTMQRHADEFAEVWQRGGLTTKRRYGRKHYRELAQRSAEVRQAATSQRDLVIREMLDDGWKIPTIIQLTLADVPKLKKYLSNGLGHYLSDERPETDSSALFVSKTGRPLTLANTYKVMRGKSTVA
jgi:general stress protein YciG